MVDDEASIRNLLTNVLAASGHDVTSADDGEEAKEYLEQGRFDLVITDLAMPGMNGIEVLVIAKRTDPNCQVIIITAYPSADDVRKIMRLGAADFVMKPFNVDWMESAVVKALEMGRRSVSTAKGT